MLKEQCPDKQKTAHCFTMITHKYLIKRYIKRQNMKIITSEIVSEKLILIEIKDKEEVRSCVSPEKTASQITAGICRLSGFIF